VLLAGCWLLGWESASPSQQAASDPEPGRALLPLAARPRWLRMTPAATIWLLSAQTALQAAPPPPGGHVRPIGPKGGGTCSTARDCQLAGECTSGHCKCDPGWTGPLCSMLDLAPLPVGFRGGAWNSELSPRSSWGAAPMEIGGVWHGWFNQLPARCGLSSWLPGSYIQHGTATSPLGPFTLVKDTPPPAGRRNPLSQFATNPHVQYVPGEKTFLIFFNGREWPSNLSAATPADMTNCWPSDNRSAYGPHGGALPDGGPYHGGGVCTGDAQCPGAFAGTDAHQGGANACIHNRCQCEHHSTGSHCTEITETVNVALAKSPHGPWTQLLPDGAAFWSDSEIPGGNAATRANLSNPDGGKYLSNPSAFVLGNGTVVLAYSRAPGGPGGTGVSTAPHWRGPYTRLYHEDKSSRSPFGGGKNYSVAGCGECVAEPILCTSWLADVCCPFVAGFACCICRDPFIYKDFRDTW
jgi:hypothetical protein